MNAPAVLVNLRNCAKLDRLHDANKIILNRTSRMERSTRLRGTHKGNCLTDWRWQPLSEQKVQTAILSRGGLP